ncbi:MAG: DNA repair protein RecO [Ktedonobacteraceae bacterium]
MLCRSQLQLALGRNLDIVTQAEGRENFLHLRTDLWHMTCGFYLAELVDRFVEDHTPHYDIYALLLDTLRYLDADANALQQQRAKATPLTPRQKEGHTRLLLRYFELRLLVAIGYEPALTNCTHCASEILPQENGFKASLGGILCPQCSRLWERRLSLDALKALRYMQRSAWSDVARMRPPARLHTELEAVMYDLLRYHLERGLKSGIFLLVIEVGWGVGGGRGGGAGRRRPAGRAGGAGCGRLGQKAAGIPGMSSPSCSPSAS